MASDSERGKASGEAKRGVRVRAESGFLLALGKMTVEMATLWEARELARTDQGKALSEVQEYRLWWLAERIIGATKAVIPISASVSSTVDIPIIPLGVIQILRGLVPGPEALAELSAVDAEAVDAEAGDAEEVPAVPLSAGRATRRDLSERNKANWQERRARERRERREHREHQEQGDEASP